MNITKELHDQLIACDFIFEKLKINQAEGLTIKVEVYFLDQWRHIRIRNSEKTTLKDVLETLTEKAFELGLEQGIKKGKKEVGEYLKNLTEL